MNWAARSDPVPPFFVGRVRIFEGRAFMQDDRGPDRGPTADDAVRRAREQFDDAVELLSLTKARLRGGEIDGLRDVAPQVALVIKTLVALGEARVKIDGLTGQDHAGGILDLEAAGAEVRGRLDRLRAAAGP